jgi:hypothetical protein
MDLGALAIFILAAAGSGVLYLILRALRRLNIP